MEGSARVKSGTLKLGLLLCVVVAMLVVPSVASADISFCPPGTGAGQCGGELGGVAADTETDRVYAADVGNNRIDVFEANGTFLFAFGWGVKDGTSVFQKCTTASGCQKGIAGSGVGQFNRPRRVAVDNTPGSGSRHDLYVFNSPQDEETPVLRVQKFDPEGNQLLAFGSFGTGPGQFNRPPDPIAAGPGGTVYIGDTLGSEAAGFSSRIEVFKADGGLLKECELPHKDNLNGDIAVDSAGNVYATYNKGGGVFRFHPDCSEYGGPYPLDPDRPGRGLEVDGADRLYVSRGEARHFPSQGPAYSVFTVYDSAWHSAEQRGL